MKLLFSLFCLLITQVAITRTQDPDVPRSTTSEPANFDFAGTGTVEGTLTAEAGSAIARKIRNSNPDLPRST